VRIENGSNSVLLDDRVVSFFLSWETVELVHREFELVFVEQEIGRAPHTSSGGGDMVPSLCDFQQRIRLFLVFLWAHAHEYCFART